MTKSQKQTFIETLRNILLGFTVCFFVTSIIATIWANLTKTKTYYLSKQLNIFITEPQYWLITSLLLIVLTAILHFCTVYIKYKK